VSTELKRRAWLFAGVALLLIALAAFALWAISIPHRPLEYMVAGTLSTAISLLAVFLFLVKRATRPPAERDVVEPRRQ
jgi:nitrate reductase gamma subunit